MTSPTAAAVAGRQGALRAWLIWTAGFLAFPVAGLAGTAAGGRVDDALAALVGGTVTGLVIGAGQALASRGRLDARRWVPATGLGMGVGLLLGASTVDYGTSLGALGVMGALTGVVLGLAQAVALPRTDGLRWVWAAAMPAVWATGWTVTTLAQIHVEEQFTVFGASGAVTVMALSGILLHLVLRSRPAPAQAAAYDRVAVAA